MKCNRMLVAALVLMLAGMAGVRAAEEVKPPAPGPAPQVKLPAPAERTLGNGLRVIVARRAELPLVTAQLAVLSGAEVDPVNLPGTASLAADVLTQGTKTLSAPQIAQQAEALGGSLDASAGWDESDLGITVTTPKLGAALALLSDVARHPAFAPAEIERARKQSLDALRVSMSQPGSLARKVAARAVFGGGSYGHPLEGTPASLVKIQRADLVQLHAKYFRPDNAVLVFAGDIEPQQAFKLAEKSFGDWNRPAKALPKAGSATGSPVAQKMIVVDLPGTGQAAVTAAHPGIDCSAGDYYIGQVANAVLGGSYSARLNQEIRIKRGLSYGAGSSLNAMRDGGWWLASAQTKNPSAAQVTGLIQAAFKRLRSTSPAADELGARKATLTGAFARHLETTSGFAGEVTELAVCNRPLTDVQKFIPRVQAVTPAQVRAFADKHLGGNGVRFVVAGDAKQFADALHKGHPKLERIEAAKLDLGRTDWMGKDKK